MATDVHAAGYLRSSGLSNRKRFRCRPKQVQPHHNQLSSTADHPWGCPCSGWREPMTPKLQLLQPHLRSLSWSSPARSTLLDRSYRLPLKAKLKADALARHFYVPKSNIRSIGLSPDGRLRFAARDESLERYQLVSNASRVTRRLQVRDVVALSQRVKLERCH